MSKPKICLNMIVKNESKIIKRCIDSVIDIIDSWCIVDTGSTDGTQDIIKDLLKDKPGVLHERPWVNFGHNRNEALELGRELGEWLLLTDADMVLVNRGFNKNELDSLYDVYDIIQDNGIISYNNMRLLNTKKQWKCIGVTHEYYNTVEPLESRGVISSLLFKDYTDGGSKGNKFTRDIALLTQGLEDEPQNSRYMFYLAQSYRDIKDYEKAIHWYETRVKAGNWEEEQWYAQYMVAWCKKESGKSFDEVYDSAMIAWRMRPWRIEPIYLLAVYARYLNLWQHAYQFSKICATADWPGNDVLFIHNQAYGPASLDEFAIASYYIGKYDEAEAACLNLLQNKDSYPSELPRIRKNLWYARKALGYYSEERLNQFIQENQLI